MPLLSFKHIHKRFKAVHALTDVSLGVDSGAVLGLIGENGAGKSTLMNVLGGVVLPDEGEMTLDGHAFTPHSPSDASSAGIAFIHQELNLFTNLSIRDNLFIDAFPRVSGVPLIKSGEADDKSLRLLSEVGLALDPGTPVDSLSPGERQLVEIAKALRLDARIFIFDEPTTSLAAKEKEHLFALIRRLRDEGKAIIYISHTLRDILRLSDYVAVLRDGAVVDYGNVRDFDIDRMIGAMVGRSLGALFPERTGSTSADVLLSAEHLSQPGIVHDVSFQLFRGEILGVFGLMGSGRTELARILFGIDPLESGEITIDDKPCTDANTRRRIALGMAFVTEDRRGDGLMMGASVSENISIASLGRYAGNLLKWVNRSALERDVRHVAGSLRIKADAIEKQPVRDLSGGNQQKTVIGRWLMADPQVFILDEPTRGIDIGAKQEVYTLIADLADNGAGILLISSEIEELIGMCDRILVLAQGEVGGFFDRPRFNEEDILRAAFREEALS